LIWAKHGPTRVTLAADGTTHYIDFTEGLAGKSIYVHAKYLEGNTLVLLVCGSLPKIQPDFSTKLEDGCDRISGTEAVFTKDSLKRLEEAQWDAHRRVDLNAELAQLKEAYKQIKRKRKK
jgi:hypothetical protein